VDIEMFMTTATKETPTTNSRVMVREHRTV